MAGEDFKQLHEKFEILLSEYSDIYEKVRGEQDWKNPFREIVAKDIPMLLEKCANIRSPYKILGSYGKGRWTAVPWIAVFDSRITTSAQKGVYIVYLVNKDTKELYLAFEIAATEVMGSRTNAKGNVVFTGVVGKTDPEMEKALKAHAEKIREAIPNNYFSADDKIDTGSLGYDHGAVYYKKYTLESLPEGEMLADDLKAMCEIYRTYYEKYFSSEKIVTTPEQEEQHDNEQEEENEVEHEEEGEKEMHMTVKEMIDRIKSYIASRGFTYTSSLIENFYLSLKSKPFVILAGTSGTGKTRLVKLFAEAIGADYKLVSVRPDWSDGSDLFGHNDLNGNFIEGPICSAFDAAKRDPQKPVFLCLDEMNLARVEYYLSDFLSVIESREKSADGKITTDAIAQYKEGIPDNLYIIGTVNMDETTFPFSKKVLDRANTIEFSYVDLLPQFDMIDPEAEPLQLPNSFLRTEYLVLARDCEAEKDFIITVCDELQRLNEILRKANAHVGYRVRDEIVFYMLNNLKAENLLIYEQALDNEIMQKILPRIQGSAAAVKDMLAELFKFCMGDYSGLDIESGSVGQQMQDLADSAKYPESAKKIGYMMTRYEEDGFTSYWL